MINEQVQSWLKARRLRPEELAAMSGVSFTTVSNGLRGLRWGSATIDKIQDAMRKYDAEHPKAVTNEKLAQRAS